MKEDRRNNIYLIITFIYTAQIQLYSFQMHLVVVIDARLVDELNPWSLL